MQVRSLWPAGATRSAGAAHLDAALIHPTENLVEVEPNEVTDLDVGDPSLSDHPPDQAYAHPEGCGQSADVDQCR